MLAITLKAQGSLWLPQVLLGPEWESQLPGNPLRLGNCVLF